MKIVYVCKDSITGIFSAVYEAWKRRNEGRELSIAIQGSVEPALFCEYQEIEESERKAAAVEKMILKNLGSLVYRDLYYASLSRNLEKGDAILGTLLAARKIPDSRKIMDHLGETHVEKVFELSRNVGEEAHLLTGFIRFRELENGVLLSEITPKNQVLPCLGPHFQDRFPMENWMIYDKGRQMFAVHEAGKQWVLAEGERLDEEVSGRLSEKELELEELWKMFCRTIAIKERKNPVCQRNNLPLWYRQNLTEFQEIHAK